jgi:hypothetical protein
VELYAHTSGSVWMGSSDGADFLALEVVAMVRRVASIVGREESKLISLWRPSEEMEFTAAYRHRQKYSSQIPAKGSIVMTRPCGRTSYCKL